MAISLTKSLRFLITHPARCSHVTEFGPMRRKSRLIHHRNWQAFTFAFHCSGVVNFINWLVWDIGCRTFGHFTLGVSKRVFLGEINICSNKTQQIVFHEDGPHPTSRESEENKIHPPPSKRKFFITLPSDFTKEIYIRNKEFQWEVFSLSL